jgi:hypothetical protein
MVAMTDETYTTEKVYSNFKSYQQVTARHFVEKWHAFLSKYGVCQHSLSCSIIVTVAWLMAKELARLLNNKDDQWEMKMASSYNKFEKKVKQVPTWTNN